MAASLRIALLFAAILLFAGCADDRPTEKPYRLAHSYSVSDPQFSRTMCSLLGPPLITDNSITTLINGDQIFPAMLDAIRSAQKTINLETYVYWRGQIGQQFTEALCDRASHGVKVHVMLDPIGSDKIDHKYESRMRSCGVHLVEYHTLRWYDWTSAERLNNRTHRKLLIVDGKVGFTGGVGIADEWMGNADSRDHWRDTHFKVEGPVVAQLQAAFADNWMTSTGHVIEGDDYFPQLSAAGQDVAQVFKSGPQGGSESMELLFLMSLAAAEKNIRIESAYFVPDKLTIQALVDARQRGVAVQIIVPGSHIDVKIVRPASRERWGTMLKAGVEIYEYSPTMIHCKEMIIDDRWTSIGSANIDNRSFRLNAEANLNVLDQQFAQQQIGIFDDDLKRSKQITFDAWKHRPFTDRIVEWTSSLFGPLM